MSIYRVLLTPNIGQEISDDDSLLIKEKFSWFAFLLPPIWAMAHNLWLELALLVALIIGLSFLTPLIGSEAGFWLYVLGVMWLGFEASAIKVASLKRKTFVAQGDLLAQNDEEAQIAWIKHRLKSPSSNSDEISQDLSK